VRWLSLIAGAGLIAIAFGAATLVADTREGLIAEVITLMAGLFGVSLLLYGMLARTRPAPRPAAFVTPASRAPSSREFTIGAAGLGLAVILIGGLAVSAGWQWAALGSVMLLPMIAGSALLCGRFLRTRQLSR
jgi:TctA family transporter